MMTVHLKKLVVITFGAYGSAAREEMLLVHPINRQDARRILVQVCGYNADYIDHILLTTMLYRLSYDGLAFWWVNCLDQTSYLRPERRGIRLILRSVREQREYAGC